MPKSEGSTVSGIWKYNRMRIAEPGAHLLRGDTTEEDVVEGICSFVLRCYDIWRFKNTSQGEKLPSKWSAVHFECFCSCSQKLLCIQIQSHLLTPHSRHGKLRQHGTTLHVKASAQTQTPSPAQICKLIYSRVQYLP